VCGDGFINSGESCEVDNNGTDLLNGNSCQTLIGSIGGRTYDQGNLTCNSGNCTFNTSDCRYTNDLTGVVQNATSNHKINGAVVTVYRGATQIAQTTTNSAGRFTIADLPHYDGYRVEVTASDGCYQGNTRRPCRSGGIADFNFTPSNPNHTDLTSPTYSAEENFYLFYDTWTGVAAIVLTWDGPRDLDTHLRFTPSSGAQHLYYSNKSGAGSVIDWDDTSAQGHETVTISTAESGILYKYYVHDYGNDNGFDTSVNIKIFNSSAKVVKEYTAQVRSNYYWEVINITPSNPSLPVTFLNNYTNTEPGQP
jgi:hypothetical protein